MGNSAVPTPPPSPPVCGLGSLKVAEYPLDLALLGEGHGHIEMQSHAVAIETLARQNPAKLVHVTELNVDAPPERDRLGINARTTAATKQCNECDIPGDGLVEACRFGGARVYGRY